MAEQNAYLTLCVILVVILLVCILLLIGSCLRLRSRNDTLRESLENLSRFNDRLRADRHDYLNHLQVVYGLMELGEYDEMEAYFRNVYKELLKTGKAIKTANPAINALLAAKSAEAEEKGIEFVIEVKSALASLGVEDWELCKVLSNLIDNALRALSDSPQPDKQLRIDITEDRDGYIFEVGNNGPAIPEDMRENIFRRGFTTKKGEGHGLGLSIVSDILTGNQGAISLKSDEKETVFTVVFEKGV